MLKISRQSIGKPLLKLLKSRNIGELMYNVAVLALQNLGEAEYVVALFMYMCLLGYPADKISILTTYNGQKHLIRDIINRRCGNNPLIGRPNKVVL